MGLAGAAATQQDVATDVFAAVGSQTTLRQLVEVKIARDLEVSATGPRGSRCSWSSVWP